MSERRFKKYMKRHLLNEDTKTFPHSLNRLQNQGVAFDEFMSNLTNYSSDTDRTEMLNMLVKFIVDMDHPESYFTDLINDLAHEFDRDESGNHITGEMSENKKPLNEEIWVDVDLMMGADAKYIPGGGKIPFDVFLKHFGKYWSDRGLEGGDSDFIAQGLENHVDDGLLTDDEVEDAMYTFWHS